jgi:predicted RNase H-like nuclease (RuvC/YqgF family)
MRKFLIPIVAAASTLAIAAPAAAQYYPAPRAPAYGYGQGYNNYGNVRALQARVNRLQRDLSHLAQYRMITRNEYNNRNKDARDIERRLRRDARDGRGLNGQEINQIERRIARLEQKMARDVRDGRRWAFRW